MRFRRPLAIALAIGMVTVFGLVSMRTGSARGEAGVTFTKNVAPIFNKHCAECHRPGEAAPFSTLSYREVRPWAKSIREKVANRTMPPWHADPHYGKFENDRRLTQAEIETVVKWVDGGAVEGDPKDMPPAPKFTDGWEIGQPDQIIPIPEEYAYKGGDDEYQYFDVPTNFTEDKYVIRAEARPGNRKIVHHIIAFIVPPGTANMGRMTTEQRNKAMEAALKNSPFYRDGFLMRIKMDQPVIDDGCAQGGRGGGNDNLLVGFAPGRNADIYAEGTARKIPAGSMIRFQIHYSNQTLGGGTVEKDKSMIGLVFTDKAPERTVTTNSIGNIMFKIPAGAENHRVTACRTLKRDTTIYALEPHMHLRGKSMEYKVFYPDGKEEILLNVPNYDFAWQTNYILKEPKRLPKGSRIMVTGIFDNSTKNKFNPDPTRDVRYGEPTYDEMMLGFMDYVTEMPPIAKIDPKILDSYTGKYEVMPNVIATVTREDNKLVISIPFRPKMEFLPESETSFFTSGGEAALTFVKDKNGEVSEALLDVGRVMKVKKVKEGPAAGGQ
ncbi:MAG: DUF3471 domain-containing protein [Acidobacteriota bacterium]|nr:MAG: DUF3471 domain-containing protein [Acidobacteriota bacterium]